MSRLFVPPISTTMNSKNNNNDNNSNIVILYQEDRNILLSQWQTCVEMANAVSERRDSVNNLFVTLNSGIITAISFIWEEKTLPLILAGILSCVVWFLYIITLKRLNAAKFRVINNIEKLLPIAAFDDEWQDLKENKNKSIFNKYIECTQLEIWLPILFSIIYIGLLAFFFNILQVNT